MTLKVLPRSIKFPSVYLTYWLDVLVDSGEVSLFSGLNHSRRRQMSPSFMQKGQHGGIKKRFQQAQQKESHCQLCNLPRACDPAWNRIESLNQSDCHCIVSYWTAESICKPQSRAWFDPQQLFRSLIPARAPQERPMGVYREPGTRLIRNRTMAKMEILYWKAWVYRLSRHVLLMQFQETRGPSLSSQPSKSDQQDQGMRLTHL